ncbi:MAG: UDP-glucose/GDP-mannose dehydrogenase family protein [Ignavibacteria bacterium]|nr:UDP-glucose/GDP-mannose dehydrogenase family protein [Ignavibacteria bacterium]
MKISVIGTGYVGLVVGTCFAETGNDVICVDIDEKKILTLRKGKSPIYEPGLEELLKKNIHEKRLTFTTDIKHAIEEAEVIFLALPTPPSENGAADLKHVLEVSKVIGKFMNGYKVIVNKSTVPVGTADKVREAISHKTDMEFDVVSNPEFLKEGAAVNDFMKPDRIVVGSRSPRAIGTMQDLYGPFVRTGNPIIIMDERSSELTKYAANAFLATKISFMNEMANLCERVGADVDMIRKGIGTDARIGSQFLFAGTGYGGSCFPKDVSALEKTSDEYNYDFKILNAVQWVNKNQRILFAQKVIDYFHKRLTGKHIALWGLSFKPNTDDMREAPSVAIIKELLKHHARVRVHDPVANEESKKHLGTSVKYYENNYDALKGADALVVVTEWNEFRRPDFDKMKSLMRGHVIFDGRNIYNPQVLREKGFEYFGIGRGAVHDDN